MATISIALRVSDCILRRSFGGETVLALAGVLSHQGLLTYSWVIPVALVGAVVGDQGWFYVGRYGLQHVLSRFPRTAKQVDRIRPLLAEKADWIAAGSRFVYGTRIPSPLLLGAEGYPRIRFLIINILSGAVWATACVSGGYLLGAATKQILGEIARIEWMLVVVVVGILGWRAWRQAKSHFMGAH